MLIPVIASVSETDVWVSSDNADVRFDFIELGSVEHDTKIVAFTATPKDRTKEMKVQSNSGLHIQVSDTGASYRLGVTEMLEMLHYHVRHMVVGMWFERGYMPRTWAEIQPNQQPTQ